MRRVPVLGVLDAASVRLWCVRTLDTLVAHRSELDRINVFPVPDGDTGTNLVLTLRSAADELSACPVTGAGPALRAMARGGVLGARGNSGVILSQFLRGLAEELGALTEIDGPRLAAALGPAGRLATAAVEEPAEGTALSVIDAAATAAATAAAAAATGRAAGGATARSAVTLAEVTCAAAGAAAEALRRTTGQLEALTRAGVVDAGGWGVAVLLGTLTEVVTGEPAALPPSTPSTPSARPPEPAGGDPGHPGDPGGLGEPGDPGEPGDHHGGDEPAGYRYEVQYLLDATAEAVRALRERLAALGDCVAVVGTGEGIWNVHVHVDDVGAAIEAGIDVGRPSRITVEPVAAPRPGDTGRLTGTGVAVVAVVHGDGIAALFRAEGVRVVGAASGAPTGAEIAAAVLGTGAASVIVLTDHGADSEAADRAARAARVRGLRVAVVPTRSPVQGLAAVAVHDRGRRFDDDVIAMAEAAAATRWAEVTVAEREALTMAGRCRAGDVLGLAEGDVVLIGGSVREVAVDLTDRLLHAGGELLTVIAGTADRAELGRELERHVATHHPGVEVRVYDGGRSHQPVILGVE